MTRRAADAGGVPARAARALRRRLAASRTVRRVAGRPAESGDSSGKLHDEAAWIVASGLFDPEWYALLRPEESGDPLSAARHYLRNGRIRGQSPNPVFRPATISQRWRSVKTDPLVRFVRTGIKRPSHPLFHPVIHLENSPEAKRHPGGPLGHLLSSSVPLATPAVPLLGKELPLWPETRRRLLEARRDLLAHRRIAEYRWSTSMDEVPQRDLLRAARRWLTEWSRGEQPLVSIVMPVRDRASIVAAAIDSVRMQSWADWELVVVDDGSTDGTVEAVRAAAAGDPRIRVIEGESRGVSAARNAGLAAARGEYIAFLDSDNQWRPDHLLVTAHALTVDAEVGGVYSIIQRQNEKDSRFLAFEGDAEQLQYMNYIDMNALVVRASVIEVAGGFDESLRRMVDWDFALGLVRHARLRLVPYLGVRYTDGGDLGDRISVSEPVSWASVVIAKHLIDWDAAQARERVPGRLSVVLVSPQWWQVARVVDNLLQREDHDDIEIVVIDNAGPELVWEVLRAKYDGVSGVVLHRTPDTLSEAVVTNLALTMCSGEHVLLHHPDFVLSDDALPELFEALAQPGVHGVQTLLEDLDGTVDSAGYGFTDLRALPVQLFAGHPSEDASAMPVRPVYAADLRGLLLRTDDAVAARGLDPLLTDDALAVDFSFRLADHQVPGFRVVSSARLRRIFDPPESKEVPPDSARLFLERWGDRLPADVDTHYDAANLQVVDFAVLEAAATVEPIVRRRVLDAVVETPRLRWAIKIAAPAGPSGDVWGDTHFAASLADALRRQGHDAVVDRSQAAVRRSSHLDDVVLVIRGLDRLDPQPGRVSMLWVISHPELVRGVELAQYDRVFAASEPWAAAANSRFGVKVAPLLQATDPRLFHPGRRGEFGAHDVLFVGSSRNVHRWIVRESLEHDVPLAIYGPRWDQFLGEGMVEGEGIPNDLLGAAYASAGVVLNDHWPDMASAGFLSNRLFDAVAAGALVVSDAAEGVDEVFDGMVRVAADGADLKRLTGPDRESHFPAVEQRLEIARRVREEHSFDARAEELIAAALSAGAHLHGGGRR